MQCAEVVQLLHQQVHYRVNYKKPTKDPFAKYFNKTKPQVLKSEPISLIMRDPHILKVRGANQGRSNGGILVYNPQIRLP